MSEERERKSELHAQQMAAQRAELELKAAQDTASHERQIKEIEDQAQAMKAHIEQKHQELQIQKERSAQEREEIEQLKKEIPEHPSADIDERLAWHGKRSRLAKLQADIDSRQLEEMKSRWFATTATPAEPFTFTGGLPSVTPAWPSRSLPQAPTLRSMSSIIMPLGFQNAAPKTSNIMTLEDLKAIENANTEALRAQENVQTARLQAALAHVEATLRIPLTPPDVLSSQLLQPLPPLSTPSGLMTAFDATYQQDLATLQSARDATRAREA